MKLNILSDLHLGFDTMEGPVNDADLVILAGDIARPRQAVAWALRLEKPVLYVPGNHEFYGGSLDGTLQELQQLCAGTHVHVLDRSEKVVAGVRFLGAMLWSDFGLFPGLEAQAKAQAQRLMRDFSRIRRSAAHADLFTPDDCVALFARDSAWLQSQLGRPFDGPTVVITHHAPTRQSVHPRFADSLLSAGFVSDAAHLLEAGRVALWIHGHTHDSFDYVCKDTRVVCNPRGYARAGVTENQAFDPDFIVDVLADTRATTPTPQADAA